MVLVAIGVGLFIPGSKDYANIVLKLPFTVEARLQVHQTVH